jgi:alanine racemase
MKQYRVWAEIDLGRLQKNIQEASSRLKNPTRIMAVVKADGYGHGAVPVAWKALASGVEMLGVGDSSEAIELRESGITGPILILGAIIEEEIPRVIEYDVAVTIHSMDFLKILSEEARRLKKDVKVHLKVDTGMGRLGATPSRAIEIAKALKKFKELKLEGISTHLSTVRSANREYIAHQLGIFKALLEELKKEDINPPLIHAANTVSLLLAEDSHFNMVRIGIALYGIDPGIFARENANFLPILSLKSRIAFLKSLPAGSFIGYDQRYKTERRTLVATIPVGYNDGYSYLLSNKASVLIKGKRAPLLGTVTMDYIMVDVTDIGGVKVGDEVTLIGKDGTEEIRVEELASIVGTIPYEITCRLGKRVKRLYLE